MKPLLIFRRANYSYLKKKKIESQPFHAVGGHAKKTTTKKQPERKCVYSGVHNIVYS